MRRKKTECGTRNSECGMRNGTRRGAPASSRAPASSPAPASSRAPASSPATRFLAALVVLVSLCSCGLEQPILNNATPFGPDWVVEAPDPYVVRGQVYGLPGASVSYYSPSGVELAAFAATADTTGFFQSEFPGSTEYRNLVVVARNGSVSFWGLALRAPRNKDIYATVDAYHLGGMTRAATRDGKPLMSNLDDRTTALSMILLRRAQVQGINLASVTMDSTNEALAELIEDMENQEGPAFELLQQVRRLLARGAGDRLLPDVFLFPDATAGFLNPAFLDVAGVDYSGDGLRDLSVDAFDVTLEAAASLVSLTGCQAVDRITVLFMLDLNEDNRDLNCNLINPFKFAQKGDGKKVFITGALYTTDPLYTTPSCEDATDANCLTQAEKTEVNQLLGNWIPNKVAMRDDGEGGDVLPGDGVWTVVFTMPYIPMDGAEGDLIGVRLGYKYTYGLPGQGWTGSEEWPGNNRILELKDVNGDGLVVRYDYFADETSNKNVSNTNSGLCGSNTNPWPEKVVAGCFSDTHENRIDTDGDCVSDAFPSAGAVAPVCEGVTPDAVKDLAYGYVQPSDSPVISAIEPASSLNGGGELVTLSGANFHPGLSAEINTANSMDVANNALPGLLVPEPGRLLFLAPPFPADSADVVLSYFETATDGSSVPGSVSAPFLYEVEKTVPAGIVYPEAMPLANEEAVPAGAQGQPTVPVLARLGLADPSSVGALRVEAGLSPPCCNEGETCLGEYGPCYALPDPRFQSGWSYVPMELDAACRVPEGSGLSDCSNESQFEAALVPPMERVQFRYVMRYSFDHGRSWDYGDLMTDDGSPGNQDGFRLSDTGLLWVE